MRALRIVGPGLLLVALAACASPSSQPPPSTPASATPDARIDVTEVSAVLSPDFPDGSVAQVSMTITNHSSAPATYDVILGVFDSALVQVGSIGVDTAASSLGPTRPGGVLRVSAPYGINQGVLPDPFSVDVLSVVRTEVTP